MKISLFHTLLLKSTAYCVYWPPLSSSRHECHVTDAQVNPVNFNDIKSVFHFIHSHSSQFLLQTYIHTFTAVYATLYHVISC